MLVLGSRFSPLALESGLGKYAPITVSGVVAVALLVSSMRWGCGSWTRHWTRRVTVGSYDLCDGGKESSREIRMSCVVGWEWLEILG